MKSLTLVFHVHHSQFFWFSSLPSLHDYEVRFPDATLSVTCEYSHPSASQAVSTSRFSPLGTRPGGGGGGGRRGLGLSNDVSQLAVTYRAVQRIIAIFFPSHFFRSEKRTGTFAIDKLIEMEYRR